MAFQDKTREKSYEELLWENELFRYVFDLIHEGVYITDENGTIIEYNRSVQETEGYSPEKILGKSEKEVYGGIPNYSFISKYSDPVRKNKKSYKDVYYEYSLGYGKKTAILMSLYPFIVDGKVKAVCTLGRNINQIKDFLVDTLSMRNYQKSHENSNDTGARYFFYDIIGESAVMKRTIARAKMVAKRDSPVLIYGETGTGKELMAQSIHNGSLFLDGPFVSVNCAAIPETLLESILFGVAKGSFTGAVEGPGLFEQAEGGTLFLDEINSMPLSLQPKILRAIQEKSVRRIGGSKEIPVNCRIISAVNKNPKEVLASGLIRDDLFFRLATIELKIPPLRDRKEDIEYLVHYFIHKYNVRFSLFIEGVSPAVSNLLMDYDWPGNIRELENFVESSMNIVTTEDRLLRSNHFSDYFQEKFAEMNDDNGRDSSDEDEKYDMKTRLLDYERKLLKESLIRNEYKIVEVAKEFGQTRQSIYQRLKKVGIEIGNKKFFE